jgi:hypothetical protein
MTFEWWLLLPIAAGIAMGLLFALSGFGDSGKAEIGKNTRTRNALWVLSGGGVAAVGDWDKLAAGAHVSKLVMAGTYGVAAFVTAGIAIAWIASSIYRDRKAELLAPGRRERMSARQLALLYAHRGYPAYYAEVEKDRTWLREEATRERERADEEAQQRADTKFIQQVRLQGCAGYAESIGGQIAAASAIDAKSSQRYRDTRVDTLLTEIVSVAIAHTALAKEDFAINFMEAMPFADGMAQFAGVTRFVFDDPARYDQLLILKHYVGRGGGENLGLPVHAQHKDARPLPGAPSVLYDGVARYIAVRSFARDFGHDFAPDELKQMVEYFKTQTFACFLTLPIQWGGRRLGVVNLDCRAAGFGLDDDPAGAFARTLLPFCMLLGSVMSASPQERGA